MKTGTSSALAKEWSGSILGLIVLLALLLQCEAAAPKAAPLKSPRRVVNGQTVDLMPLFHWWTNHQGDRPLTAWVRVSGTISANNALDWVISGQVEKSKERAEEKGRHSSSRVDTHQFLLKNPPTQEAAEFERLHQELTQANEERGRLQREEADVKANSHRIRGRSAGQLHRIEQADKDATKRLDEQIADLRKKLAVYPSPDHYQIDAIALDTGTEHNHLPVFDYGMVLQ